MSHELRTPLNSILGFSDLLKRQISGELNHRQINHVKLIEKSGQHLLQLINDILDLSKIEAGKTELNLQAVEIHRLCSECLKMIQPRADKKRLALSLELDYRLNQVLLDERRVRQIIINLLSNAVKFTRATPAACIRIGWQPARPGWCELQIEDNGAGFDPRFADRLFKVFQRLHSANEFPGTGVGLASVKRIVLRHGGDIWAESQPGQGARFCFTLAG
jgi:signal transduction histidine kinase